LFNIRYYASAVSKKSGEPADGLYEFAVAPSNTTTSNKTSSESSSNATSTSSSA